MIPFIALGVVIVLLLVIVILAYRSQMQQAKHYGAIQATIAEAATNQVRHRADLDTVLRDLHEKQRNETITETAHLAERNGLSDTFSDGLPDWSAPAGDANHNAAIAGTSSAASHTQRRTDLSE